MALGIDIYRYQTVTNWVTVKRHGVSFVYVKGTDGGAPAIVRADNQVRGAQSVDIPVGLYHYAQLTPSPEAQADVLTGEVRRLGATGLPPALDLEEPHKAGAAARDFANRFIARMRHNGFERVTLYANVSMLVGINALQIDDDPNILIWAAAYGSNDGRRHALSYRGRVNVHQYTSVGVVPGISGRVDLNESLTPLGGNDMPSVLDETMERFSWDGKEHQRAGDLIANGYSYAKTLSTIQVPAVLAAVTAIANNPDVDLAALTQIIDEATPTAADVAAELRPGLVTELLDAVGPVLADAVGDEVAGDVLRQLGEKLAETSDATVGLGPAGQELNHG